MMKKVGCYIRNNFVFSSRGDAVDEVRNISSSIECAKECHDNSTCKNGWSYQIATKDCFLYKENQAFDLGKKHLDKEILTLIGLLQKHFLDDFLIIFSFLYLNTTLDKLQPSTQILGTEYTIGWATGLKACSEPGK